MRHHNPGDPVYAPNSKGGPAADTARFGEPAGWHVDGDMQRAAYTLHAEDDDWGQPGTLVREVMDDAARDRLVGNVVGHLLQRRERAGASARVRLLEAHRRERRHSDRGRRARPAGVGTTGRPSRSKRAAHRVGAVVTEVIAGIAIPDSRLVADATAFVRDAENDLLFHHSRRVFLFGALHGKRLGLKPDPELLYVGALFHDMGLTPSYAAEPVRFEVNSANATREFLRDHDVGENDVARVWLGIALHTTPGVPALLEPEVALVSAGVDTDVLGIGYRDLDAEQIAEVTAAHPRPDFKRRILQAFTDGMRLRPHTTFGTMNADVLERFVPGFERTNFVDVIEGSDWPE